MVINATELRMDKLPSDITIAADKNELSSNNQHIRSNSTDEGGQEGGDQSAVGESAFVESDLINRLSDIHISGQTPATANSQRNLHKNKLLAPKPAAGEEDERDRAQSGVDVVHHHARSPSGGVPTHQQQQSTLQSHGYHLAGAKRGGDSMGESSQYAAIPSSDTSPYVTKALRPIREPVESIDPSILKSLPTFQPFIDQQLGCNHYGNYQQQQLSSCASSPASSYASYASYPTPPHTFSAQLQPNQSLADYDYNYSQAYQPQPDSPPYQASYASSSPGQSSLSQGPGSVESNHMYEAVNSPLKQTNDQIINDTLDVAQKVFGEGYAINESFPTMASPPSTYQPIQSPQNTTNTIYGTYPPNLVPPRNANQASYGISGNAYSPPLPSTTASMITSPRAYAMPLTAVPDYRQATYSHPAALLQQTRLTSVPPQTAYYQQDGQGMRNQTAVVSPQMQPPYLTSTVQNNTTAVPVSAQLPATMSVGLPQADPFHQYHSRAPPPYTEYPTTNGPVHNASAGFTRDLPNLGANVFQDIDPDTAQPKVNEDGKIQIKKLEKPKPPKPVPVTFSLIVIATPTLIAKPATTTYREIKPNPKQAQELANQPSNEKQKGTKKGRKPGSKSKKNVPGELAKSFIAGCTDDDLLSRRENGHTFLTLAIAEGPSKRENVVALLDAAVRTRPQLKALLTKRNESNFQSPLFLAVLTGQTWLVQKLLEFGADDDQCSLLPKSDSGHEGYTALQYASKYGSRCLDSLKLLLRSKKIANSINMPNSDGMTALQLAIYHHKDIDPKDHKDPKSATNNMEAINCLLRHESINLNCEDNKSGKTSLHLAVDKGDLEMVKLIADAGATIDATNYEGRTSLHLAASLRRSELVKLDICQYLLQKGASKRIKDKSKEVPRSLVPPNETQLISLLGDDMGGVVSLSPITTDLFS